MTSGPLAGVGAAILRTVVVNAYYGDAGYIENGSNGQVMVEQPKFYYKMVPLKIDRIPDYGSEYRQGDCCCASGDLTITLNGVAFLPCP